MAAKAPGASILSAFENAVAKLLADIGLRVAVPVAPPPSGLNGAGHGTISPQTPAPVGTGSGTAPAQPRILSMPPIQRPLAAGGHAAGQLSPPIERPAIGSQFPVILSPIAGNVFPVRSIDGAPFPPVVNFAAAPPEGVKGKAAKVAVANSKAAMLAQPGLNSYQIDAIDGHFSGFESDNAGTYTGPIGKVIVNPPKQRGTVAGVGSRGQVLS